MNLRVSDYVADYVIREDCPSAANLEFADKLGHAMRGDGEWVGSVWVPWNKLPKKHPQTPEDKQKRKRLAEKTARRRERHRT